jgi:dTDP-4-amino-4,6-dideoxygalactose transaminase
VHRREFEGWAGEVGEHLRSQPTPQAVLSLRRLRPMTTFAKPFTRQEPIPEWGIRRAVEIMRSGRLHRYDVDAGEASEVASLEREYAAYQGARYCLACASGGAAIQIALRAAGVRAGEPVLTNAFTLAPVPGALHAVGAKAVLVEIDDDYVIDVDDLRAKAAVSAAHHLLLSHMRGHIADMRAVVAACDDHGLTLIEDCAHTMGARFDGVRSGNFGRVGCFSTQTYKHLNSGEGGLLTTDDPDLAARAVLHSGSYMHYGRHGAIPDPEAFARVRLESANLSARMDNLRAALVRAQLPELDDRVRRWNILYRTIEAELEGVTGIRVPVRGPREHYVGSSFQFVVAGLGLEQIPGFVAGCAAKGVELKWFGEDEPRGFTSRFDSWRFLGRLPDLPRTRSVLAKTLDMRLPLTFDPDDCRLIATIIKEQLTLGGGRDAAIPTSRVSAGPRDRAPSPG